MDTLTIPAVYRQAVLELAAGKPVRTDQMSTEARVAILKAAASLLLATIPEAERPATPTAAPTPETPAPPRDTRDADERKD